MGAITLITGGARSGKSAKAQMIAEAAPAPRAYIATCPIIDGEIEKRVQAHRREREGKGYTTIEEPVNLPLALRRAERFNVAIVDCVTLWANNLMYEAEKKGGAFSESDAAEKAGEALAACGEVGAQVIFVTNEVGMGVIPDNESARRFVDIAGRINQIIAAAASEVIFMASGVPQKIK